MTDKQITIDGVDVSRCGHYHYGKCEIDYDEWNNEIIRYNECQNNPNCHFKQLARKEQECKDLREDIKDIANLLDLDTGEEYNFSNIELEIKQLKAKEQECEELQNKFLELNGKAHSNSLELDQLKQTLTEIKGMCNSVENIENVKSLYDAALSGMYLQANKILKKISEVISE